MIFLLVFLSNGNKVIEICLESGVLTTSIINFKAILVLKKQKRVDS